VFDKGRIEVAIPKTHFTPGDTISGKVSLTLKKPVKAKEMCISLIGEQTTTRGGGLAGGERKEEKERFYNFKVSLDGEKEYDKGGDYPFEIKIPADILSTRGQLPQPGGGVGQAMKIAQVVVGAGVATKWYLEAKLDVPRGIDIRRETHITIG